MHVERKHGQKKNKTSDKRRTQRDGETTQNEKHIKNNMEGKKSSTWHREIVP